MTTRFVKAQRGIHHEPYDKFIGRKSRYWGPYPGPDSMCSASHFLTLHDWLCWLDDEMIGEIQQLRGLRLAADYDVTIVTYIVELADAPDPHAWIEERMRHCAERYRLHLRGERDERATLVKFAPMCKFTPLAQPAVSRPKGPPSELALKCLAAYRRDQERHRE